jgi:hypothetical protein
MQTATKQQLFAKLAEVQDLLEQATCDGQTFAENFEEEMGWAAEIDTALRTLTDSVGYYVD